MLYLYDNAIVDDLKKSFNPDNVPNPVVKVVAPEQIIGIAAQIKNDELGFPIIALSRSDDSGIDSNLNNFTKSIRGVPAVFDTETNNIYYEKALPVNLSYTLDVLTTNQVDMDEILRELIFKYNSMYFLSIKVPYESKRDISFGIVIDTDSGISKKSGVSDYTSTGQLYQSSIQLKCEGCVILHYTPQHLNRNVIELDVS